VKDLEGIAEPVVPDRTGAKMLCDLGFGLPSRQMKRQREGNDPHGRSSMDAAEIQTYGQKWGRCCVSPTFELGDTLRVTYLYDRGGG